MEYSPKCKTADHSPDQSLLQTLMEAQPYLSNLPLHYAYYQLGWLILCVNLAGPQHTDIWQNIILDISVGFFSFFFWMRLTLKSGEGNGTPLQYSCLENPMDGGAW